MLRVQRLNELATVKHTIQVIVTEEENERILTKPLPEFLTGERVLLVAVGSVVAGIDLDELGENDARVVGEEVTLDLPDARTLASGLDEDKSKLYDRDRGLLKISGNDALLEEARRDAEDRMVEVARENGLVELAQNSIRELLVSLGYEQVVLLEGGLYDQDQSLRPPL